MYSKQSHDNATLKKILSTWIICPLLAAVIAIVLLKISKYFGRRIGLSLIRSDAYKRIALVFAGALGAYSLGANNIANVIGVFIPVKPLPDLTIGYFYFSSTQQLFLIGGLAIAFGVCT